MAALRIEERLYVEEVIFGDFVGENCVSRQGQNFALFSDSEIKVLAEVKGHLNGKSARQISQLSHMEIGYLAAKARDFICYELMLRTALLKCDN